MGRQLEIKDQLQASTGRKNTLIQKSKQIIIIIIIQFFIIYMPSQQLQGQLQTQHSVDTSNYITEQYSIKSSNN
jgi:hypothetical protein